MRKRQRLLSELSISVLAGVILAGAAKTIATVTRAHWLNAPVPLWWVILGAATSVSLAVVLVGLRIRRPKRVLVMIPAFVQKHWLAKFLQNTVQALESQGYDAVVKLPFHDFSGQGQLLQLAAASRRAREYAGALILTADPETMRSELPRLCSRAGFPVVFVDVMPFPRSEELPEGSCFVGSNQADIGGAAGRWVANTMVKRKKRTPRVLVIGGMPQTERQQAFVTVLKDRLPGAMVEVNDHGDFVRDKSREITCRYLRDARQRDVIPDAIFCTNDEMAFGALDAIQEEGVPASAYSNLVVIGVDGTDEAMSVIRSGSTAFRATVVQNSRQMAETATATLIRALEGERPQPQTIVPVGIYPPDPS